jgi:spore maturation protein CgeB
MRRRALERLGHATVPVDYLAIFQRSSRWARRAQWRLRQGPMIVAYDRALRAALDRSADALWIDKGLFVGPELLQEARRRGVTLSIHYSPDNYFLAQNSSRHFWQSVPLYDVIVTTKTANIDALKRRGARRVLLSGNAYDPDTHRPVDLTPAERQVYECDVSFVGRWEPERERWLERVAAMGVRLAISGYRWERARSPAVRRAYRGGPALGDDYAKSMCGARINLALLSRLAADAITQRSVEIPACGAFMLAERTGEHLAHFKEDAEAAYFEGPDELCDKIAWFLGHADERARIARAGRQRCLSSRYSYDERLADVLTFVRAAA